MAKAHRVVTGTEFIACPCDRASCKARNRLQKAQARKGFRLQARKEERAA